MAATTDEMIQSLAAQLSTLQDPKGALDHAVRSERARLELEARRVASDLAKLEAEELTKAAKRVAEEKARERALDEKDAREFEAVAARAIARVAEHAVGLILSIEAAESLKSPRGRGTGNVRGAISPYLENEFAEKLARINSYGNGHWTAVRYLAWLIAPQYAANSSVIYDALRRVRALDAAAKNAGEKAP